MVYSCTRTFEIEIEKVRARKFEVGPRLSLPFPHSYIRKGPGLTVAALAASNRDDSNLNAQAQLLQKNENFKQLDDLEAQVAKLRAENEAPSKLQPVPKLTLVPHCSPATLKETGMGPSEGIIEVGNDSPSTIVQIPLGSTKSLASSAKSLASSGMQTDMNAEFDNSYDEDGEEVESQNSASRLVNFTHAPYIPPSGAEATSSSVEETRAVARTGMRSHGKEGVEQGQGECNVCG